MRAWKPPFSALLHFKAGWFKEAKLLQKTQLTGSKNICRCVSKIWGQKCPRSACCCPDIRWRLWDPAGRRGYISAHFLLSENTKSFQGICRSEVSPQSEFRTTFSVYLEEQNAARSLILIWCVNVVNAKAPLLITSISVKAAGRKSLSCLHPLFWTAYHADLLPAGIQAPKSFPSAHIKSDLTSIPLSCFDSFNPVSLKYSGYVKAQKKHLLGFRKNPVFWLKIVVFFPALETLEK